MKQSSRFVNRVKACLYLSMLGDSAGATVEGMEWKDILKAAGPNRSVEDFVYGRVGARSTLKGLPLPQWTDDTCLSFLNWTAILRKGGRINAYDLFDVWYEEIPANRNEAVDFVKFAPSTYTVREKLKYFSDNEIRSFQSTAVDLRDLGRGVRMSVVGALGITPIGIVNACHPRNAAEDAYDIAGFCQEGHVRDGAACFAAAIAEALRPGATIESIVNAAREHGGVKFRTRIDDALKIASKYDAEDIHACIGEFDEKLKMPWWADPLELIPIAIAFFAISNADPRRCILMSVYYGRDCDGIAQFSAALCGALQGVENVPEDLLQLAKRIPAEFHKNLIDKGIKNPSPRSLLKEWDFDRIAEDLSNVAISVMRSNLQAVQELDSLL